MIKKVIEKGIKSKEKLLGKGQGQIRIDGERTVTKTELLEEETAQKGIDMGRGSSKTELIEKGVKPELN